MTQGFPLHGTPAVYLAEVEQLYRALRQLPGYDRSTTRHPAYAAIVTQIRAAADRYRSSVAEAWS